MFKFGATISDVDLNNVDDELFAALREAIYKYELVLFKGQHDLKPIEHFNFVKRFDPNAPDLHGHGTLETVRKTHKGAPTLLAAVRLPNFMEFNRVLISYPQVSTHMIPGAPGVRLVAAGYQGKDHYGLKDIEFRTSTILNTHANPPTQEEIDAGITRFGRWHIDFAGWELHAPLVTALRCVKLPVGPEQTLRWDDGTGREIKVKPGLTAFYSCEQQYAEFSPEEREMVDNSEVQYAAHPYQWISRCKQDSMGITIPQGQGLEMKPDERPQVDESKVQRLPMVWHNPVTGKGAFMVHAIIAEKLFIKKTKNSAVQVIDNVDEVRALLLGLMKRMVSPENVMVAPYEEGDVAVWNNRGMDHTFIEYPKSYGPRSMHQVNIAGSHPPS
ncbi:MAG: hypothetical protein CL912_18490 [Deltaproteobacteria bacterium]|nr:hypothetical protein [Deltaproteobacteria bacterium]